MNTKRAGRFIFKRNRQKAFTIIEVVIVLTIATVLLMVIFLALSTLKRVQHDNFRKDYAAQVFEALLEFKTDNGRFPGCDSDSHAPIGVACGTSTAETDAINFLSTYLPNGVDPDTGTYKDPLIHHPDGKRAYPDTDNIYYYYDASGVDHFAKPAPGVIHIGVGHVCYSDAPDGTNSVVTGNDINTAKLYVLVGLTKSTFCVSTR